MALSHAAVRQAQSAQIAEVQKLLAAGFDSKADSELGALLSHPDQRIRLEAQWTLAARPGGTKTLATIARRFYGDEREAERIWQANRDRLRSPALVVPGMELRLP